MSPTPDLHEVMAEISTISGYFHLYTGPGDASWRPLTDLLTDVSALERRIAHTLDLLEIDEPRVGASLVQQGLASRLWSPVFGAAVLCGRVPAWTPDRLLWRDVPSGPMPLRLPDPQIRTDVDLAEALYGDVVSFLEPLADLLRSTVKISPRLLWDNAASALAGTVQVLAWWRPSHAAAAISLGRRVLALGHLQASDRLLEPSPGRPSFTRTGCCLYYRVPGSGKCSDCALLPGRTKERTRKS
ncbi:(2Fe-2S)-binding protein [Actinocorallia sp. B10E7]|uniref:(2Fe-2S)-binding protein n=1 Tax=Actinocorallia sp. B10E7 TaxID=3153558 RepID=UPI00325F3F0B